MRPIPTDDLVELQEAVRNRTAFKFSNFERWGGSSLEHLYQAAKAVSREDQRLVMSARTPGEAKRLGRQIKVRPDWEEIKLAIMWDLLRKKFQGGQERGLFSMRLAEFEGEIVEWNTWHDTFWGRCVCDKHRGEGTNWLGVLLMLRRSQLQCEL